MDETLFKFHKLNAEGIAKAQYIQEVFSSTLRQLETAIPTGREFSIVKTKLEEACFFAKKGMAVQKENQETV